MFSKFVPKQREIRAVQFQDPPRREGMGNVFSYYGETFTCNHLPVVGDYLVKGRGYMTKAQFEKEFTAADAS